MAKQTKELAVIDFEKFSIAQLPELQGKKEEIASVIKANPIVEIVDNSTYELAKKSRTAVRSLRTSLESEQKTVKKKIKERVLDVVDGEYNLLVTLVKGSEKERQDPIDTWETKKEEERLEKLRLEELRVKQIKDAIQTFKDAWIDNVNHLLFEGIEGFNEMFEAYSAKFNRSQLAEYEVLFDDALLVIRQLADSKIKTLTEQEQIRIDNLLIQEKNAENSRIQDWQRTWNANIDTLSFDDLKDVKSVLVKSKLADLKHYSSEYEQIYTSTEKRLHSQIELISKAEEQRIAQEKFLKEKKEFEEKKLQEWKQVVENRKSHLLSLGFTKNEDGDFCFLDFVFLLSDIVSLNAEAYSVILEDALNFIKSDAERKIEFEPVVSETIETSENYHEADVDAKGVAKTHEFANYQEEVQHIEQIPTKSEVTWNNIYNLFQDQTQLKKDLSIKDAFDWLSKNYNVPTKKQ